jgi:4-hydroxyphenylacetate 3-monooxygenase
MRQGSEYLEALDDGRAVIVDGDAVTSVRDHPAFRGVAQSVADLYDVAAAEPDLMAYDPPWDGGPVNKVFMIPRSTDDLRARRAAIERWSRLSRGFLGRSPDHVAGMLAGFSIGADVFARGGTQFAHNVRRLYQRVAEEDLYVTYAIIPPQDDRSKAGAEHAEPKQVRVVKERDDGIVVRGAQMLGTGATVSDLVLVACLPPLKPGDEDFALSFVVPCGASGLKWYCRRPYALDKPSVYDYPLSTRFDETDALAVFDDVFVPWEQVFVYRDVDLSRAQFDDTPARILGNTQAQIRLATKVKFLIGLAHRIVSTNGIEKLPPVQEKLGELASLAAVVEGLVLASEATASERDGAVIPNPRYLFAAMGLQAEIYPRVLSLLRELSGGGMLQVPSSSQDLVSDRTAADVARYFNSPGVDAQQRVKLFKLAWDAVGSEFGSRHHQYEMFYAGPPHVLKALAAKHFGYEEPAGLVDDFLRGYDIETPAPARLVDSQVTATASS